METPATKLFAVKLVTLIRFVSPELCIFVTVPLAFTVNPYVIEATDV